MVRLKELYLNSKAELEKAGVESPAFDVLCIFEQVFDFNGRGYITVHGDDIVSDEKAEMCINMINERKSRPLQYILGKWEFMGLDFFVGEGVLVPREDTEVLVRTACRFIGEKSAKVLDLCAGSGAVGISVALECANANVKEVEISSLAMDYLKKNIEKLCPKRVEAVYGNVLEAPIGDEKYDVIVSNPPYIPTDDINTLSRDVKCEPLLALDGGKDGLVFYRAILENYLPLLNESGLLAVEIGLDQSQDVCDLFHQYGLCEVEDYKDLNDIDRVIKGIKACR